MEQGGLHPTRRFSDRASAYDLARPDYPEALFDFLFEVGALFPSCVVADLGSGTGIFSEQLLDRGLLVYAIEPNDAMRMKAESRLLGRNGFISIAASAEGTTLPDKSVDAVTAAQAFHWFDVERTRQELGRVLRPKGQVIMVWNNRKEELDGFHLAYSRLVERFGHGRDDVTRLREGLADRFYIFGYSKEEFEHAKEFDLEGLECLIHSASYMPREGDEGHDVMMIELRELFSRFNEGGKVRLRYRTECFFGRLD